MIFNFKTGSVTFFEEDKAYFEKRFAHLEKFLGSESGDNDSIVIDIKIDKNKHTSGDIFDSAANITGPNHGKFHAEISAANIKECADKLEDKLKIQILKFHDKHKK